MEEKRINTHTIFVFLYLSTQYIALVNGLKMYILISQYCISLKRHLDNSYTIFSSAIFVIATTDTHEGI